MTKPFYLSTTLPYVNAPPHIGHALEFVQADALARYHRDFLGEEVFFNTGVDEHGVKIYRKAVEEGKEPQAYVDEYAPRFARLREALNLSYDNFIRTTNPQHAAAAQEFWRRCEKNGDIYKKNYLTRYCVGCELEKTDSELENGRCMIHPHLALEEYEEENYFFRFSSCQKALVELYDRYPDFVLPNHRLKEIRNFVEKGLQDFSISRLKSKMPWGVPVPGDDDHVMYVWFDALVNYVSALGWPGHEARSPEKPHLGASMEHETGANASRFTLHASRFEDFWGTKDAPNAVQIAGKDNLRQQAAIWQAMLISAGLPTSRQILIHGFINVGGEKISKSLGNVIDPVALAEKYGTDAVRYYLLKEIPTFGDGDFTIERFEEVYNADLANGLGNLTARLLALAETHLPEPIARPAPADFPADYRNALAGSDLKKALDFVTEKVRGLDRRIGETEPFKLIKNDPEKGRALLQELLAELYWIGRMLLPFMPSANAAIKKAILENKKPATLFPRLS